MYYLTTDTKIDGLNIAGVNFYHFLKKIEVQIFPNVEIYIEHIWK